jgi:large subunit ribosomal protein L21
MFAVFEDGSRQYRVREGDHVTVDYRDGEKGTRVEFPRVLLYQSNDDLRIGRPIVEGTRVLGEIIEQTSTKVYVQKYRRRKHYRRLRGHRQPYTRVQIRSILLPGMEPPAPPAPPEAAASEKPGTTPPESQPVPAPPAASETSDSTPTTPPSA